jgi:2-C-methyl-D-erythritol 4-phosphate cytidylyltransferase/2-C-methyl-D-erythritol 2,4-cyclodiphosphate synthase
MSTAGQSHARIAALIVAAGRGSRLGTGVAKQYLDLGGRPMLAHSIAAFARHPFVCEIACVIHPDDISSYRQCVAGFSSDFESTLREPVSGGATRQESVLAGLEALAEREPPEIVLIHDAARPFVTEGLISDVLGAIGAGSGAIPGRPIADTIKRAEPNGMVGETLARDGLFAVSTPQGFRFAEILAAHRQVARAGIGGLTDDAAVAEQAGLTVRVVATSEPNVKITTMSDLEAARQRLAGREIPDIRTGNGYDIHVLGPGDRVTLCGVRIPHDQALQGHSDADVGLHALTDAMLATIADGDIGDHFPPSDPQWRGAASDQFLAFAVARVAERGGRISNLDVTLICEAPKIAPHREAMRKRIAEIAGIGLDRVSVKATTNEGVGFVGRREGIAAIATATAIFERGKE